MQISDGTFPVPLRPMFAFGLSDLLLASFDSPPTGDRDPTVDVGGGQVVRTRPVRPVRVRPPQPRARRQARPDGWRLAFGIASSASLLVLAMGILSMVGVLALYLLA